jgi:hypothetical protein
LLSRSRPTLVRSLLRRAAGKAKRSMHRRFYLFAAAASSCLLPGGYGPRDPKVAIQDTVSLDGYPLPLAK